MVQIMQKLPRLQLLFGGAIALLLILFGGLLWYLGRTSQPVEPQRPVVVALSVLASPPREQLVNGFLHKMEELGYQEGQNVIYKRHDPIRPSPEGLTQAREVYLSYVQEEIDLIVTTGNPEGNIALEVTQTAGKPIPIVALDMFDPIEKGLIKSFQSSGNNLTGIAEKRADSVGKFLSVFTLVIPDIKTIGVLTDGFMIASPTAPALDYLAALRSQAKEFGIEIVEHKTNVVGSGLEKELVRILNNVKENEQDAWVHIPGHIIPDQQVYEHEMGKRAKIPFAVPATIETGPGGEVVGLVAYGANFEKKGGQGAIMADKILRGMAQPQEIPIEFPVKYDLVINLKVAAEIGVSIPPEILELADRVIE